MKRAVLTVCFLALVASLAYAQYPVVRYDEPKPTKTVEQWNDISLPDKTVLGIVCILADDVRLGGLSYRDRVGIDPEVETDFKDLVSRFATAFNRSFRSGKRTFYVTPAVDDKEYLITMTIKSVTENGNTVADVVITTPDGEATISNIKGKGGMIGSFINLMGDGFESLGKELADRIQSAVFKNKIKK